MRRFLTATLLFTFLAMCSAPVHAQRFLGTITGTVTDSSGAVVPNADVTITEDATGFTRSAKTDSQGNYSLAQLPLGTYKIQVTQTGFKQSVKTGVELHVADVLSVPFQLQVGATAEVMTVEASGVQVNTESGEVAGLINGQQVRKLPLNGRNFVQLTQLMPGVSTNEGFNPKDKGLLTGVDISVSGGGVTNNLWLVDGGNNNDVGSNRTILVYPSVDNIAEFKVHRNNYGAEFGQAAGAQVNIVTRSGSNQFHGSLYYFGRNDALNANDYFLSRTGEKSKLRRHDYGFTVGGPVLSDRVFFFFSEEWNKEKRGQTKVALVPTAEERAGNFNSPLPAGCGRGASVPIDPLTGNPFPGNQIPANRISPAGSAFLQLYALPNVSLGSDCTNWIGNLTTPIDWRQESARGDINLTKNTQLMLRYTQDKWVSGSPNAGGFWGDDPFPAVDAAWNQPGRQAVGKLTQTFGAGAVNSFQFSYSANRIIVSRAGENPELNDQINAAYIPIFGFGDKIAGEQVGHPIFWGGGGYPTLWTQGPWNNRQDLYALKDDFSKVMGSHTWKAGALYSWNAKDEEVLSSSNQNSEFWGSTGLTTGSGTTTGSILADFLLRDMKFGFDEFRTSPVAQTRWKDLEFYVGDTWKASRNLTLDFGLRYSLLYEPYDDINAISSFIPSLFNPALGNDPCNGVAFAEANPCTAAGFAGGSVAEHRSLRATDKNAFAPRFGFAWDVFSNARSVLRGGFGQFFQRERVSPYLVATGNPPFNSNRGGERTLDSTTCIGCSTAAGTPTAALEQSVRLPNSWQWNLTVEQEVLPNSILEVAYVGNRGIHLTSTYAVNQVAPENRLAFARATIAQAPTATLAALRPFAALGTNNNIGTFGRSGDSIYHALQSQFRTRFGRGSQFQASYTWSRLIENALLNNSDGGLSFESSVDLSNPSADRGPSSIHRPHVFNASLVYLTPQLSTAPSLVKGVFGDWEVANIIVLNHGAAVTVNTGTVPGVNGPSGTGFTNNQRPNRVPGEPCTVSGGPSEAFLNPNAFTLTGFQLGQIGTAGRGACYGPGSATVDLALYKNWSVPFFKSRFTSESMKIQFRFETFNLFNKANFQGRPDFNTSLAPSSVTYDSTMTTITNSTTAGNFGISTKARDPRQIQYALKFIF